MAGDTSITIVGNLTADPELRYTKSGTPVASFSIASTPRTYDRQGGGWKDGQALFMRCTLWNQAAENLVESVSKGMRLIVQGRLKQRSFETREGEQRHVIELEVDAVGPDLRWATASVTKASQAPAEQAVAEDEPEPVGSAA